jgi:predicted DsbA family dithiol-disulfide isomerase
MTASGPRGKAAWPAGVSAIMHVDIWADVVCPWCYLGKRRFERALESFEGGDDVTVTYHSFELDPTMPPGVTTPTVERLASKYQMSPEQAEQAQRQMEQRATGDGLTFRMNGLVSGNTRDAHRLLQLAKVRGHQAELMERLHRAYFSEQGSIFDHASLTSLAAEAGLDPGEVAQVLPTDEYGGAVDADEEMARSLGATGVPFFVIGRRYAFSGAQSPETIAEVLQRASADATAS